MGRLYWKLFIVFWLAFVLIAVGALAGLKMYRTHLEQSLFEDSARPEVHILARTLAEDGEAAALRVLKEVQGRGHWPRVIVVDQDNRRLNGKQYRRKMSHLIDRVRKEPLSAPQRYVTAPSGKEYLVIATGQMEWDGKPSEETHNKVRLSAQWIILSTAGVVCLLICFWLARYISRPMRRISGASRSIAEGDLSVRVAPVIGKRKDEIADLAHDFDAMTSQLEQLINGQQRLLQDVSHELRSPLARLEMAVGLIHKKNPGLTSVELDRIEKDVRRLGELIGQVLTLSRLENDITDTRTELVDVDALLETIVEDANFESAVRACG